MAKTILAIDIGSIKVSAVIAEIDDNNQMTIIGHGITKSQGVKKGTITNIELASKAIKKAVTDARRMAGNTIAVATISISNAYAKSINSTGIVNIPHKDISIKEIRRAMDTALYNAKIPNDYEIIHVLPYKFKVDDQVSIEDPYGMNASRLEVNVNIVVTPKTALSNLQKTVRLAGVEIEGIVLNSYASAISTMSEDERALGVCVIDMGGQTSNMIVHIGNSIRYTDFLPVGSNHITNDLSMTLHTPLSVAENLKIRHGDLTNKSTATIELPIIGDENSRNEISLEIVHSIILARVEETLLLLEKSLSQSGLKDNIGTSIVLTGGMTKLKGIRELAQTIFQDVSVRVGLPRELNGVYNEMRDQSYATVIGLLLYQAREHTQYEINYNKELLHHKDITSDIGLRNIDLAREKNPNNQKSETSSKGGSNKQMNIVIGDGLREDPFDFDKLPDNDKQEKKTMKKLINWAKQLF